jgi:hypothetical protein
MSDVHFEINLNGIPYIVEATPFEFNTETRFYVSYNGGPEHVFTWDSSLGRLTAIDDDAADIPDDLEAAISEKLQTTV